MIFRDLHFPTSIYISNFNNENLNKDLEDKILKWANDDKGITRTNIKGWHSNSDMQERPEYQELINLLYKAQKTIYEQEHLASEAFLGNMWANINPPGAMNRAHMHPNSLWSGVYYVKASKNSGLLKIDDPRSSAAMSRPRMKEGIPPKRLWREVSYEPVSGKLIMFPSWLTHSVDPNESADIRISISFNFMQKCMIT
tara:strand:+ start:172 stop:765 length:594 start_codon:yes stop_codon:yes gene_type:complete